MIRFLTVGAWRGAQEAQRQPGGGSPLARWVRALAWVALGLTVAACERPPVQAVQGGFRGTGMVQIYNPRTLDAAAELNAEPKIAPAARIRPGTPLAGATYENVQVLGDLSLAEFGRTMTAISAWVAPEQGCLYCHEAGNFASDKLYTKVVARRMFQMTQKINAQWKDHVAETGVTCYTCHRGNPVPLNYWMIDAPQKIIGTGLGNRDGQNTPSPRVGLTSLPNRVFKEYLFEDTYVRVNGEGALPGQAGPQPGASIKQAEHTYGIMMHMAKALGVNCNFCHNTKAFQNWEISAPQRMTAWHGLRMVRQLNNEVFSAEPLTSLFPPERRGPLGDVYKINCATCHQGAYKPLYGSHLSRYYPAVVPADLRPEVPPTPPLYPNRLPPVRAGLEAAGARDPAKRMPAAPPQN